MEPTDRSRGVEAIGRWRLVKARAKGRWTRVAAGGG